VRQQQSFSQHDLAEFLGTAVGAVRSWERGDSLPDRTLWSQLEEALGLRVPDPRVPKIADADRHMIDALLAVVDELGSSAKNSSRPGCCAPPRRPPPRHNAELMDTKDAAAYLGVSVGALRGWTYQRLLPYHRLGGLVRFATRDLDAFVSAARIAPTGPVARPRRPCPVTRRPPTGGGPDAGVLVRDRARRFDDGALDDAEHQLADGRVVSGLRWGATLADRWPLEDLVGANWDRC